MTVYCVFKCVEEGCTDLWDIYLIEEEANQAVKALIEADHLSHIGVKQTKYERPNWFVENWEVVE